MLRVRGAPKFNRLFLLALWAGHDRVDARRSLVMLQAVQDAFAGPMPLRYFQATCDDEEEAVAMHALHESRFEFQSRQGTGPVSEG